MCFWPNILSGAPGCRNLEHSTVDTLPYLLIKTFNVQQCAQSLRILKYLLQTLNTVRVVKYTNYVNYTDWGQQ